MTWCRATRQDYDEDGYVRLAFGAGEVTRQEDASDDEHGAVAQLWLPDPGERRGWALYHVWRTERQTRRQYGFRGGRG